jgi:F0F1-type ATP synthase assembly protein I
MQDDPRKRRESRFPGLARYATLGFELAAAIVGFTLIGIWVDRWSQSTPLWTLIGAALGIIGGFYNFIREALELSRSTAAKPPLITRPGQTRRTTHRTARAARSADKPQHTAKAEDATDKQQPPPTPTPPDERPPASPP